jgi:thioesterase domain-containing protein/NRPS condensation-like uncharacterized protein
MRIWFVEQLAERAAVNNLHFGVRLSGQLDLLALDQSLSIIVDRHEALRTTFDLRDGEPVQFTDDGLPPVRTLIDLSGRPAKDLEKDVYTRARREAYTPFDLKRGPLIRLVVLRLDPQNYILLVIVHQIICDGWSLGLFAHELAACYAALCSGTTPTLKPLSLQYADYACWQREWLDSEGCKEQLSYWTRKLAGANLLLDLSADSGRPAEQCFEGASQARRLPDDLVKQLRAIATRYNATSFALLLTVFEILLHQYTGETDILIGMPVAGRASLELEEVIGLFANLVVLRTDLLGDRPFSDLLREVRNTVLEALTNQYLPFDRLVETLHPSRSLAQNPVFQVLFASVKAAAPWKTFGGLRASPYNIEAAAAAFDLSVSCVEDSPDTSWLRVEYRTDLFNYSQIESLLDRYLRLLSSVAASPELCVSQLKQPCGWPVGGPRHSREAVSGRRKVLSCGDTLPRDARTASAESQPRLPDQSAGQFEETLADLWLKVLGLRPPAATSNFFDLGGHSLLAVRLASEIGRIYGTNFPVSLVFQAPTIEGMARRLRAQISSASSVIAVQEDGSLPPFFCGGSIHQFVDLSRALGSDLPFFQLDVFALQLHRLFANEPLYASVPDLAARFRRDILSIQPAGRYYLGGMCEGGVVALEIALQLQDEGREVAFLAAFDTPVNGYWRKRWIDWLQHSWSLFYSGRLVPRMRDQARNFIAGPAKNNPEQETYAHILRVTWEAVRTYCPNRVFEGEIQLFRAPLPPTWFREDVTVGWHTRASQGIRVHDVVGDHFEMFCDPLSQRIIAESIARARSRPAAE